MNKDEVLQKLNEVFREVFDDDSISLIETSTVSEIQDWDSLEFVNIIVAVMSTFNIKFSIEELKSLENIGAMADLIIKRCGV